MVFTIKCFGASRMGTMRPTKEDTFAIGRRLMFVADGMGGMAAGEIASGIAHDEMLPLDTQPLTPTVKEAIRARLVAADAAICSAAAGDLDLHGMGTTITLLLIVEDIGYVAALGDSRAFHLRGGDFRRLTTDHTVGAALNHPPDSRMHNVLYAFLGGEMEGADPFPAEIKLAAGDRLALTTDGVTNELPEAELHGIIARAATPEEAVEEVMRRLRNVAKDDHTIVVVFVE